MAKQLNRGNSYTDLIVRSNEWNEIIDRINLIRRLSDADIGNGVYRVQDDGVIGREPFENGLLVGAGQLRLPDYEEPTPTDPMPEPEPPPTPDPPPMPPDPPPVADLYRGSITAGRAVVGTSEFHGYSTGWIGRANPANIQGQSSWAMLSVRNTRSGISIHRFSIDKAISASVFTGKEITLTRGSTTLSLPFDEGTYAEEQFHNWEWNTRLRIASPNTYTMVIQEHTSPTFYQDQTDQRIFRLVGGVGNLKFVPQALSDTDKMALARVLGRR